MKKRKNKTKKSGSNPLISIVILNYNGVEYLKKIIPPILELNYTNYEIIVVDNGSVDGSTGYLNQFSKIKVKMIKIIKNVGCSAGKNVGVKNAKGEYILLLDEDILIRNKDILKELLLEYRLLEKSCKSENKKTKSNVGFISILLSQGGISLTTLYGGFINWFSLYESRKVNINQIIGIKTFRCVSPDGGAIFFKKNQWNDIGGFDESQPYYMDVGDLGIRATIFGYENYVYCKDYFVHLGRLRKENNKPWCWKYRYCFSGLARVMLKNFSLRNVLVYFPLLYSFFLVKTLKHFILREDFYVISAFIWSKILFLKNLRDTFKNREIIQKNRRIGDSILFEIKPPKFN